MRKLIFILLILLITNIVFSNQINFIEPLSGTNFNSGEKVEVIVELVKTDISSDYHAIQIISNCQEGLKSNTLLSEQVLDFEEKTTIKVDFDSIGITGNCDITAEYFYHSTNYGYILVEKTQKGILFNPIEENSLITVVRNTGNYFYPNSAHKMIYYSFYPHQDITGLIIEETIPPKFEISTVPLNNTANQKSFDWTYDAQTKKLKILFTNSEKILANNFHINFFAELGAEFEPQEKVNLSGTWKVLGESGSVIGKDFFTIAGYNIPDCPISDEALLEYINKWSKMELSNSEIENDQIILQIIDKWKGC